jgi:hypothetical protein
MERRAMSLVRNYIYGLKYGKWANKKQFIELYSDKFSRNELDNATHFANLADDHRDFVYKGSLKYSVAVELGKTVPALLEKYLHEFFDGVEYEELEDEKKAQLDNLIYKWVGSEIAHIQAEKLGVMVSRERIKNFRKNWKESREKRELEKSQETDTPTLFFEDQAKADWDAEVRRLEKRYEELVARLMRQPVEDAGDAVKTHIRLSGMEKEKAQAIMATLAEQVENVAQYAGSVTMASSNE